MKEKELDDVLLVGGGIIPKKDMQDLEKMGMGKLLVLEPLLMKH